MGRWKTLTQDPENAAAAAGGQRGMKRKYDAPNHKAPSKNGTPNPPHLIRRKPETANLELTQDATIKLDPSCSHRGTMRVGCSLSRQHAAFALIMGRRFAGAFVAAPRCGGLAPSSLSSEARAFGAAAGQQPSNRCGPARR